MDRRKLFDLAQLARALLAAEAVRRIDAIFEAERTINGLPAEQRLADLVDPCCPFRHQITGTRPAARCRRRDAYL